MIITAPRITQTDEMDTASIYMEVAAMDLPKYMDPAIVEVIGAIEEQGLQMVGPMFSYHHRLPSDVFYFEVGFPVSGSFKEQGRVKPSILPAEQVVKSIYKGPYERLGQAWGELKAWVEKEELAAGGRFWESYLNNPEEVGDASEYLTELNWVIGSD